MSAPPVVRLTRANIGYPQTVVMRDVDLRLDRGEQVALVGANGSGKTTLVRALLGLEPLLSGSLELFGTPAQEFRQRWRIGYVPQRHTVGGSVPATVTEVVATGRLAQASTWHWPSAADRAADRAVVAQAIETVGLAERSSARVATLSGGQQRRVLIARALASQPEVMIMDEPTAGVDAESQRRLAATLEVLAGQGLTLLVVTHDVEPLQSLLTRTVRLRDGRISPALGA